MSIGGNEIPNGWASTTFGVVADYVNGRCFKSTEWEVSGLPIIRIQNLNKDDAPFNYTNSVFEEKYSVRNGDLLFSWSASLGVYLWKGGDAWLNQHIFRVVPYQVDKKYLYYSLTHHLSGLSGKTHGQGMVHITKGKFESHEILLPPLAEQHRIVAKIEELFSELDKGIENLKTAREQLKVYRQALLKHAFEGKLTEQWRKDNADKLEPADQLLERIKQEREARYQQQVGEWKAAVEQWEAGGKEGKKPTKPGKPKCVPDIALEEINELNQLPSDWIWVRLSTAAAVTGGLTKNSKRASYKIQMPYLRVANVYANKLDLREVKNIGVQPQEINRVTLQSGDLLVVEGNGSLDQIGRVSVWTGEIDPCLHQNHLIKARLLPSVIPSFVLHFLLSKQGRDLIVKEASSTSGLHTLSLSKVGNLKIPVASFAEQSQVLSVLEEKLSVIEKTEMELADQLLKSEGLRQSILKKAFSGQLIPQDPNDEPASVLLERIAKEKELAASKAKEAKKPNKKTKPSKTATRKAS